MNFITNDVLLATARPEAGQPRLTLCCHLRCDFLRCEAGGDIQQSQTRHLFHTGFHAINNVLAEHLVAAANTHDLHSGPVLIL
ncbi:hypothetical protein D3C76_1534460 [compost metagenome]